MPLAALATVADLVGFGVDASNGTRAAKALDAASAAVRDAAGHPISSVTSTVQLVGRSSRWLHLPAGPVTAVSTVLVDGAAVTDWRLFPGGRLLRDCGTWTGGHLLRGGATWAVAETIVTVTYTHGSTVDADIVALVCALAASAMAAASEGFDPQIGVQSVRVDDASETYVTGAAARVSPVEIPEAQRLALAVRFGGGAHVVGTGT